MNFYAYSSPIILNDTMFTLYGGNTGSSVAAQRQAAYLISEMAVSDDIGTYLMPTIVTGTFAYNPLRQIQLEHNYITRIILTRFIDEEEDIYYTVSGTSNVYVHLLNDVRGIVSIDSSCLAGCCHMSNNPYKTQLVYETGLPTGTSNQPDIALGLTTYADIVLNEIIGYGNESVGDIGVESFRNQQYSEQRVAMIRTVFGTSARAQFIHKLLTRWRKYRKVGL